MHKSTLAMAYEAGLNPFDIVSASVGINKTVGDIAAQLLGNRNTYFDRNNRERFGTRVHTLEVFCARLVLGAVESAQPKSTPDRRFRAVLFACDGSVLHQTDDNRVLDQHAATIELQYEASKLNEGKMLASLVERQCKQLRKQLEAAERIFAIVTKQGP